MSTQQASLPIPHITFGDRLRRLRLDVGLTQDAFGDEIGLSGATIAKYELRRVPPARPTVLRNLLTLRYGRDVAEWVVDGTPTDYELETSGVVVPFRRSA